MYGAEGYVLNDQVDEHITAVQLSYADAPTMYVNDKKGVLMDIEFASLGMCGEEIDEIYTPSDEEIDAFVGKLEDICNAGFSPRILTWPQFGSDETERYVLARLGPVASLISRATLGVVMDHEHSSEWIEIGASNAHAETASAFIQSYFNLIERQAAHTTRDNLPNVRLNTGQLVHDIERLAKVQLDVEVPHNIDVFVENKLARHGNRTYVNALVEDNASSFTYDHRMKALARRITAKANTPIEKSHVIFTWIRNNVPYDHERGQKTDGYGLLEYRGALQTFRDRTGVCGESAALQVTMERLVGNQAVIAVVGKDHAVAAHIEPDRRIILVDTTNDQGFNAPYTEYQLLSDMHSLARYKL